MSKQQKRILFTCLFVFLFAVAVIFRNQIISYLYLFSGTTNIPAPSGISTTTEQMIADYNNNNLDAVIAGADARLVLNTGDIDALVAKANALAQKGSLTFREKEYGQQAIDVASQVLAIQPENSEAWRIIGYSNEIMQNYTEAHSSYAKAIKFNPNNAAAMFGDAHAWDLQGNHVKAEAGYRAAATSDRNLYEVHVGLGKMYILKGDSNNALAEFVLAASSTPNIRLRAEAEYAVSSILQRMGNLGDAEYYGRQATFTDPSYPLGWVGLGMAIFSKDIQGKDLSDSVRLGYIKESLGYFDKAIQLNPNQSLAHFYFAVEFMLLGQTDQAKNILEKTKDIVPKDITLSASGKAEMLSEIDSELEAIKVLKKANI